MGDLSPKEIAIAVPNMARRMALASETQRDHNPRISRIPSEVSQTVAVQARYGMAAPGMNESTCAAYSRKPAKCFRSKVLSQRPKRPATADKNAEPRATRA